jgi:hypothetical protein
VLAKGVGEDDDTSEVAAASDERGVGILPAAGSVGSDICVLSSFATEAGIWSILSVCWQERVSRQSLEVTIMNHLPSELP